MWIATAWTASGLCGQQPFQVARKANDQSTGKTCLPRPSGFCGLYCMKVASSFRGRTGCLAQSANRLFGTGPLFLTDNPNRRNRYQVVPNTKLNTLVSNQQPGQAQLVSGSLQNIFFAPFLLCIGWCFGRGKGSVVFFVTRGGFVLEVL